MNDLYIQPKGETERCSLELPVELNQELLNNNMIADKKVFREILKLPMSDFEKYIFGKIYSSGIGTKETMEINSYLELTSTGKVLFILLKNIQIPIKKITSSETTVVIKTQHNYLKICIAIVSQYFEMKVHLDEKNNKLIFQIFGRKY